MAMHAGRKRETERTDSQVCEEPEQEHDCKVANEEANVLRGHGCGAKVDADDDQDLWDSNRVSRDSAHGQAWE